MCNAWNHSSYCTCGWGGDGHSGGGGGGSGYQGWGAVASWGGGSTLDSPNAICPECDEPVFFIRPQNGGAVWFDELGWPWPKHPCMDTQESRSAAPTHVPLNRYPGEVPIGWVRHTSNPLIGYSEAHDCWRAWVDHVGVYFPGRPLEPLSPLFVKWDEADGRLGTIEYLALDGGEIEDVAIEVFRPSSWYLLQRLAEPRQLEWSFLVKMVEAKGHVSREVAEAIVEEIREATDWLIERGWESSLSGPHLVLSKLKNILRDQTELDPESVLKWMALLSR